MKVTASVKVDLGGVTRLRSEAARRVADVVAVAAHRIEARAKTLVPVDTGATKNSIRPEFSPDGLRADIGPSTEYALPLELGHHTRSGSYVAGRPFMVPALEAERDNFRRAVQQAVSRP